MAKRNIGMWLYQNSGGVEIQKKIIKKLKDREIDVLPNINLKDAIAKNGHIIYEMKNKKVKLDKLDLFFSYNAGEQTPYQVYLYKALNRIIPMINSFEAFELSEDKFQTSFYLRKHGILTADYKLCHSDNSHRLNTIMKKWGKMVYKPVDGWGGIGVTKIENEEALNMLIPFLSQINLKHFYVEKYVDYDNTDYRVDIVDSQFVACYGRKAATGHWKTNVTSGGSVFLREANDEIINLAINATKVLGLDIAGVDIIYDRKKEKYIVLEVNGIPAFATPEQEKMGLDFNDKKIDLIVDLIDRKTIKKEIIK
jgi:ribosomal protein S6--L-glutamate ligase